MKYQNKIMWLHENLTLDNISRIREIKDIEELLNLDENLDSYIKDKLLD